MNNLQINSKKFFENNILKKNFMKISNDVKAPNGILELSADCEDKCD